MANAGQISTPSTGKHQVNSAVKHHTTTTFSVESKVGDYKDKENVKKM